MSRSWFGSALALAMLFGCDGSSALVEDDAGTPDAGAPDAGTPDAGAPDAGADAGTLIIAPQIEAGDRHVCYLFADGRVKCWGELDGTIQSRLGNAPGEMGANLPFLDFGDDAQVIALSGGQQSFCAIFASNELKCWGANQSGQLGSESRGRLRPSPDLLAVDLGTGRHAVDVSIGWGHACAVLDDGSLKCWGNNTSGKLGYGDIASRGGEVDSMGDNLPTVDLGSGRSAVRVSAHAFHTCALLDDGSMKCWGEAANGSPGSAATGGQLGQEGFTDIGDDPDEMGDNLPAIRFGTNRTAVSIETGAGSSCAVLDNATLKCFGRNDGNGEIGAGDSLPHGSAPGTMGDALLPVSVGTGRTVQQVSAGRGHMCALLDNGDVKCWGLSTPLGQGAPMGNIGDGPGEMGDDLPAVDLGTGRSAVAVTTFESHTCVILDNDAIKCWGVNNVGQLGLGDTETRGDDDGEMGDALPEVELE